MTPIMAPADTEAYFLWGAGRAFLLTSANTMAIQEFLERTSLFKGVDPDVFKQLVVASRLKNYERGSRIETAIRVLSRWEREGTVVNGLGRLHARRSASPSSLERGLRSPRRPLDRSDAVTAVSGSAARA